MIGGVLVPHPRLHYSEVPTPTATVWQPDLIHHLLFGLYCFLCQRGSRTCEQCASRRSTQIHAWRHSRRKASLVWLFWPSIIG